MKTYTAILLYPDDTPDIETYITGVDAETPEDAVELARIDAADANDGQLKPEDFRLVALFLGDCELMLDIRDGV